jgi:hypothetical protein
MPMSRRKRRRAKSTIVKHSIFIDGHRTSVSLEDAFWKGLKESAGVRRAAYGTAARSSCGLSMLNDGGQAVIGAVAVDRTQRAG